MIVVMFESKIVVKARLKPASIERRSVLPKRNSSLKCSKISTFASTAMPMDRMMPATPGSVKVASSIFKRKSSKMT